MSEVVTELPIIDISELDNPETRQQFYKKLRTIARDIGFFYLVGHGIPVEERNQLLTTMQRFFKLSKEEKEKISMTNSRHFRGYTAITEEYTRTKPDFREQIDIGEELPLVNLSPDDPIWLNLEGPNQWPESLPELKEYALIWQQKTRQVVIKLLKAFLVALELPEDSLNEIIQNPPQHNLKLIHYPPIDEAADSDQGVGAHKDGGILTLLWQDNVGGLQVKTDDGWIDIAPLENAFVVNIGEALELATNGYLRANIHQVVRKKRNASRFAIAYFLAPSLRARTYPLLPLPPHLAALARGPQSDPLNPMFRDIGKNSIKGRLRSHLSVTKQFYPKEYEEIVARNNIS